MNDARVLALITIALYSTHAILSRLISMGSQFVLLTLSFAFTLVALLVYFAGVYGHSLPGRLRAVKPAYFLVGPLGYFVYSVALIQSYRAFNSASQTTLLNYTWPLFTVLFTETLFRVKTGRAVAQRAVEAIGIGAGFLSVLVLSSEGSLTGLDLSNAPGLLWGVLAGASYGMFSAYSGTVSGDEHGTFLLTSIGVSLIMMAGMSISEMGLANAPTLRDVLAAAGWGCITNAMGFMVWTRANRLARESGIGVSSIASAMFALPLVSLGLIAILLRETHLFQVYFVFSLALLLLSSLLCQKTDAVIDLAGRLRCRLGLASGRMR